MKLKLIFIQGLFLVLASCSKVEEPAMTSFQMKMVDHVTGDSLPDVSFRIDGFSNTVGTHRTNAYGNFDTIFADFDGRTDFHITPLPYEQYYVVTSANIVSGENTQFELPVLGIGSLQYQFDCSGNGYIQNVKHKRLVPFQAGDPAGNSNLGAPASVYVQDCYTSGVYAAFSGDWIITYDYKSTNSAPWVEKSDTVSLATGEAFVYTITY